MKKTLFTFPLGVLKSVRDFALTRQKDLKVKIDSLKKEDPFKDTDRANNNLETDDVNEQVDHQRVEAIQAELEKNLRDTENALKKIEEGKYGFCENCGKLIDTARLEVNPLALFCLNCEKKRSNL